MLATCIPMYARALHGKDGTLGSQAYGHEGQANFSVSRRELNVILLDACEAEMNITLKFEYRLLDVAVRGDYASTFFDGVTRREVCLKHDRIFACDGAFSAVRARLQRTPRFNYEQFYIPHGYKELTILAGEDGQHLLQPVEALHIWPRNQFMLIGLPNQDGTFTMTLFMPFAKFDELTTDDKVTAFFEEYFADVLPLMPNLIKDWHENPTSALVQVKCGPWNFGDRICLLGDAAHAVVPFHGQGMNGSLQDVETFMRFLNEADGNFAKAIPAFADFQKPNGDALAELSMHNYIVMRDSVTSPLFLFRSRIEKFLNLVVPSWIPRYMMVTFHEEIPYAEVLERDARQNAIVNNVLGVGSVAALAGLAFAGFKLLEHMRK